jgi:hypothetical protein
MGKVTIGTRNSKKPAPKWYRKLEEALLIIIIPSAVIMIQGWGFEDEAFVNKLIIIFNVALVALVKAIGVLLANGENYQKNQDV